MIKRVTLLIIALASLAGMAYWWQWGNTDSGKVKGSIIQKQDPMILTSEPIQPFISDRSGVWNIYTYQEFRDQMVPIIPSSQDQLLPVMIDDEQLLYFSKEDEFFKLWKYSIGNQKKTFLLALREMPKQLITAPNGHYAIYSVTDAKKLNGSLRSFLIHIDTREVQPIEDDIQTIQISPDSRRLIYNKESGVYYSEILRSGTITEPLLIVTGTIYSPIFSNTGDKIYYVAEREDNYVLAGNDLRGQEEKTIIEVPRIADVTGWSLDLSADGEEIVYTQLIDAETLTGFIGRVMIDGSQWTELIDKGIFAQWSESASDEILYNTLDLVSGTLEVQIWKMNAQGNYREAITREGNNWLSLPEGSSVRL